MKWNIFVGSLVLGLGLSTQSFGFDLLDRMLGMDYAGSGCEASCCETRCVDPGPSCGTEDPCEAQCGSCNSCCKTPILDKIRSHVCKLKSFKLRSRCNSCEDKCGDPGCGAEPTCGADACCGDGCEDACGSCGSHGKKRHGSLFGNLFKCRHKSAGCCEPACGAEPTCGADPCGDGCGDACGSCGKKRHGSLLDRIFSRRGHHHKSAGCCEPVCGAEPTCGVDPGCGADYGESVVPAPAPVKAAPKKAQGAQVMPPAPVVDPSAFLPTKRRFIQTNLVR